MLLKVDYLKSYVTDLSKMFSQYINLRKLKSYQAYFSAQAETGNQLFSCKMQTKQTNKKHTQTNGG